MSRKRSIIKIRGDDDDDSSSQSSNTSSHRRNRSIPRLIDEEDIFTAIRGMFKQCIGAYACVAMIAGMLANLTCTLYSEMR
jgi:glutamine phosphoribosylpyrophosphate amidotransferase